ncbi:hypothetical protein ES702_05665 [subsurface metagenome]
MLLKTGVDISRLNREIRRALGTISVIFWKYGHELVITSTYEGDHSPGSLHYSNDAVDIRAPVNRAGEIFAEIRELLGVDFDVVDEVDHIHIEYDPK